MKLINKFSGSYLDKMGAGKMITSILISEVTFLFSDCRIFLVLFLRTELELGDVTVKRDYRRNVMGVQAVILMKILFNQGISITNSHGTIL